MQPDRVEVYESLIEQLMDREFAVVQAFFDHADINALRTELLRRKAQGLMRPASIGSKQEKHQNEEIRRDVICWIEEDETIVPVRHFLLQMEEFMQYLNQTCYTGLRDAEFHFALYETGSFYRRHRDQFQKDSGRKYSAVLYLNETWSPQDGGELVIYTKDEDIIISPQGGTLVFFKSDRLDHEVLVTNKPRLSVVGWFKT